MRRLIGWAAVGERSGGSFVGWGLDSCSVDSCSVDSCSAVNLNIFDYDITNITFL